MNVSVFHNFNEVSENLALPAVLEHIRDGRFRSRIETLRALLQDDNKKEYDKQKKSLPAFTPSATFEGGRKPEFLVRYSGIIFSTSTIFLLMKCWLSNSLLLKFLLRLLAS